MFFYIEEKDEDKRLDAFLAESLPMFSRSKIQAEIKKNNVFVNNKSVKASYNLKEDDVIECKFNDEVNILKPMPENIPIEIVWEDENMAVVNKPSNMLTHPTDIEMSKTLVNALLYIYNDNLSTINGYLRPGIIHRLDRNTSGLIMIAKNNKTHEFLVEEMKKKNFVKKYVAIVKGIIIADEFEIALPIGRHLTQPHKQCVRDDGKEALTLVKVLNRYNNATLVELTLVTGRTHQIRVHMAYLGHPIYNDTLYGFGKPKIKTEEQVLQSYKLEFTKPFSDQRIMLEIPFDEKIQKVIKFLG